MVSAKADFEEILDNDEAFSCSARSRPATRPRAAGRTAGSRPSCPRRTRTWRPRSPGTAPTRTSTAGTSTRCCAGGAWSPCPCRRDRLHRAARGSGPGLAHHQLRRHKKLTESGIIMYLAHSRVTEQRASEQMQSLRKYAGSRQDVGRAIRMISHDENTHLAYCQEELLRLASAGHAGTIGRTLRARSPSIGTSAGRSWLTCWRWCAGRPGSG